MAHRLDDEAGVTRALAIGIRMTPAEIAKGRLMRAPDGHDAPVTQASVQDFIADQFLGGADNPQPEEEENPEGEELEGEQEEAEQAESEETTEEEGEAPEPIAAPVSWDKDAKELFEQLPPDLQQKVADREAQREKAIQTATTEAANAKRNAAVEANSLFAEQQRQYASKLEQIASQIAPQPPRRTDYATADEFLFAQDAYQIRAAQHQQMMQQAEAVRQEAQQRDAFNRQHEIEQNAKVLADHFGETWSDTSKRQALLTGLEQVGADLGYPKELMGQASATDILALAKASEWKAKAAKYDDLQNTKMEAVRAAKGKPRVNKPGVSAGSAEKSARGRDAAWAAVKASGGRSGDANAAFFENMGIKL